MRTYILNATGADISPATIIICVVIAAICIFAVISYRKKLKNGCCGGGGDEVKHVKPQVINVRTTFALCVCRSTPPVRCTTV